ncbi:MAG TPA: S-layer homology domain-containing protein [Clostridia bacterium]
MQKKTAVLFCIVLFFNLFSISISAENIKIDIFTDVPNDHWAFEPIHYIRRLGITDGIGKNLFGLGQTIKRCEFAAFLVKLLKWELVFPEEYSFIDNADRKEWYYPYIETALLNGAIVKESDRFRPNDLITREEMATMIVRALGYDSLACRLAELGNPFDDVTKNPGYITIAKDFGIITGYSDGTFRPDDHAKREEAAAMMARLHQKLNCKINEMHAFYAIDSSIQAHMIKHFNSVGFGWSRLEYDHKSNSVILNLTSNNNNEYSIPPSFTDPLNEAKSNNTAALLMVTVNNEIIKDGEAGSGLVLAEYILTDPQLRVKVADLIVATVNNTAAYSIKTGFDGVVIDFECLKGELAKQSLNEFLRDLKADLDKNNKLLYVAVHPARKPGQAYYDGYDYRTIADIADRVILMAHDYYAKELNDYEMQIGYTDTPLTPIDEIYYALKTITDKETGIQDLSKILFQFSFDSVQWKLKDGKVTNKLPFHPYYSSINDRLAMDGVDLYYSEFSQNPYARFFDPADETDNVLWFEDSRSIQAKINLSRMFGISGISIWRLGNIPDYEQSAVYLDIWQTIMNNFDSGHLH